MLNVDGAEEQKLDILIASFSWLLIDSIYSKTSKTSCREIIHYTKYHVDSSYHLTLNKTKKYWSIHDNIFLGNLITIFSYWNYRLEYIFEQKLKKNKFEANDMY